MKFSRFVVVAVVAALALGACSSDKKAGTTGSNGSATGSVTLYVPASLKVIAERLVKVYTTKHKGAKVTVNTNATPASLKTVVTKGGSAVLLLADATFPAIAANLKPVSLAQNRAAIAVSATNPKKVTSVAAFAATSGLHTSLCGAKTGVGNTIQWVLLKSKVKADPKSIGVGCQRKSMLELAKNQLDAVLLFRGGAFPPKGVKLLDIPAQQNYIVKFSFLVAGKSKADKQFGAFLASAGARRILTLNGYLA
jgi:ABC-type molybdate transport system substrate-binding protein